MVQILFLILHSNLFVCKMKTLAWATGDDNNKSPTLMSACERGFKDTRISSLNDTYYLSYLLERNSKDKNELSSTCVCVRARYHMEYTLNGVSIYTKCSLVDRGYLH